MTKKMNTKRHSSLARAAMTLLFTVLTTVTAWADEWPEYVTDIIVVGGSESEVNSAKSYNSGYTWCSMDLNEDASGDYIYFGYKKSRTANTNGGYITDIIVIDAEGTNPPSTVTYDGRTYYLCSYDGGSHFESVKGNLNSNCGSGWNIYLYYTKQEYSSTKRAVSSIDVNSTKAGSINCYYKNGSKEEEQIDLNRGISGSSDVYMHLSTATKVNRPYPEPSMASNLVYDGQPKQLISSSYSNSNSGTLYYRVSTTGSYTSTVANVTATNAGTYTVYYYSGSNSYGNSSESYAHSKTVTIGKAQNSGATVVCADILEGNTLTPQLGGTNLSTGAVTYKYCTTPDGDYTTTAPTTAGTYYVKATVAADGNCNEFTTAYASFKIVGDWALHNSGDSEADAYVISTTDELDLLAQRVNNGTDYKDKFFKLDADITYSHTTDWNDVTSTENNFTRIGDANNTFKGTFDGQRYTIKGIRYTSSNNNLGLFGKITGGATVKNVILSDARIIGKDNCGGIAGNCEQSTITNCWVKSNVCIGNKDYKGGIAGYSYKGTISGCRSEATLTAYSSSNIYYGGIAGQAFSSEVSQCVVVGATIPNAGNRGAIVGNNYQSTLTSNYYTVCTVVGVANAANVGCQGGDANGARQAVAIGAATGVTVTPTGTATTYDVSGITAYDGNSGILYGGTLYAGATETVRLNIEYTAPEYFALNGFTDGNGNALTDNGDGTYTLTMTGAAATITPDLTDLWGIADGRDGSTAAKAYRITTPAGLDLLASNVNGCNYYQNTYFVLANDIIYDANVLTLDLDGDGNNDSNYMPVGKDASPFMGNFDGQGHTISGISVNANGMDYIGVFGRNDGTVKNLTVSDCLFAGKGRVGAIAGYNRGTVENCHVATYVSVIGKSTVGGVVGENEGFVLGCTSAATLSAKEYARYFGGIAGRNSGTLTDNLFTGTIGKMPDSPFNSGIGAITGDNDTERGMLTNNFHTCSGMGGVGNDNDATNTDQAGAQLAYEFPTANAAMGAAGSTYAEGETYEGITAYANGLAYNGKYYCPSLWGGSGTEADPYIIVNTQGMDKLATDVNGGNYYDGSYFVLGNDIVYAPDVLTLDLDGDGENDSNYMPVGNDGSSFMGNFDGQGHTISGIRVNANNMNFIGVFGINDGTVKNLTVSDCLFAGSETIGAIAGLNRGTVENCHVAAYVSVIGYFGVGGIVGDNDGATDGGFVLGCTSAATLSANKEAARYFGGIAGSNTGTLTDNLFTGTIDKMPDGSRRIGAITGYNNTDYGGTLTNNFHTCGGIPTLTRTAHRLPWPAAPSLMPASSVKRKRHTAARNTPVSLLMRTASTTMVSIFISASGAVAARRQTRMLSTTPLEWISLLMTSTAATTILILTLCWATILSTAPMPSPSTSTVTARTTATTCQWVMMVLLSWATLTARATPSAASASMPMGWISSVFSESMTVL